MILRFLPGILIFSAILWAYYNSFSVPFLLDDILHIHDNHTIRQIWPLWELFTNTRPVLNLSLALNYATHRLDPWGYHLFNLGLHLLATFTLFGILRRTLENPIFKGRYNHTAAWLACFAALLWALHPLQTQSVTYIIQRSESMMGLFFFLTLYGTIRGSTVHPASLFWYGLAILSCALGMGCKAVIAVAPVVVLLYDRTFLARSFKEIFTQRRLLYLGLAGSWGVLALLNFLMETDRPTVGFALETLTPLQYLLTQPEIILHYLKLALWPNRLVFDYGWKVVESTQQAAVPLALIGALLLGTVLIYRKQPALGFLGAWFFLTLAPTSSFFPIKDLAFEYRMYLPLVSVTTLVVIGSWELLSFRGFRGLTPGGQTLLGLAWLLFLTVVLGGLTIQRNHIYQSDLSLWKDTVAKRPNNPRARNQYGKALDEAGRPQEALFEYRRALELKPHYAEVHNNLGVSFAERGDSAKAIHHLKAALQIRPLYAKAHNNLGVELANTGKPYEAVDHYQKALELMPGYVEALTNLGVTLVGLGKVEEGISHYDQALKINPSLMAIHNNLGFAREHQGRLKEALAYYKRALELEPGHPQVRKNLERVLLRLGQ